MGNDRSTHLLHTTDGRAHTIIVERLTMQGPYAIGSMPTGIPSKDLAWVWAASLAWEDENAVRPSIALAQTLGSADAWQSVPLPFTLPLLPRYARHLSATFDQNGVPAFCWQAADAIFVTQYDISKGKYVLHGGFLGVDPVLYLDALSSDQYAGSDIIMFYMDNGRKVVKYRLQRDLYRQEYKLAELKDLIATENSVYYLDQAIPLWKKYELALWSRKYGKRYLISNPYPFFYKDKFGLSYETVKMISQTILVSVPDLISNMKLGYSTQEMFYSTALLEYFAKHELNFKYDTVEMFYQDPLIKAQIENKMRFNYEAIEMFYKDTLYNDNGRDVFGLDYDSLEMFYQDSLINERVKEQLGFKYKSEEMFYFDSVVNTPQKSQLKLIYEPVSMFYEGEPAGGIPQSSSILHHWKITEGLLNVSGQAPQEGDKIASWTDSVGGWQLSSHTNFEPIYKDGVVPHLSFNAQGLDSPTSPIISGARTYALYLRIDLNYNMFILQHNANETNLARIRTYSSFNQGIRLYSNLNGGTGWSWTSHYDPVYQIGADNLLVFTVDDNELMNSFTVYLNGTKVSNGNYQTKRIITDGTKRMVLGAQYDSPYRAWHFRGIIWGLCIWNTKLTEQEISSLTFNDISGI